MKNKDPQLRAVLETLGRFQVSPGTWQLWQLGNYTGHLAAPSACLRASTASRQEEEETFQHPWRNCIHWLFLSTYRMADSLHQGL